MIKEIILTEIRKFGGDEKLLERLYAHGTKVCKRWIVNTYVNADKNIPVSVGIKMFSNLSGLTVDSVRCLYYVNSDIPMSELRKKKEFNYVQSALLGVFPNELFWDSLMPFAFKELKKIAAEEAFKKDFNVSWVVENLNMKKTLVYKIHKEFWTNYVNEKGKIL